MWLGWKGQCCWPHIVQNPDSGISENLDFGLRITRSHLCGLLVSEFLDSELTLFYSTVIRAKDFLFKMSDIRILITRSWALRNTPSTTRVGNVAGGKDCPLWQSVFYVYLVKPTRTVQGVPVLTTFPFFSPKNAGQSNCTAGRKVQGYPS